MKKTLTLTVALLCLASMVFASEDWRGTNRASGYLVDKATGKPIPNAKLKFRMQKGSKGGPDVAADGNGKWAVLGIQSGLWAIDVEAPGYVLRQTSLALGEQQRLPPMKIEMEAAAAPAAGDSTAAAAEVPKEEVKIGGQTVSKDVADAVEAGNTSLGAKNFKDAIASYEKAAAAMPTFMPIRFALARAYYGDGQIKKAIASMETVVAADPSNSQDSMLLANMLLEDQQLDRATKIIETLPEGSMDMNTLLNTGIAMMNKKQPGAAVSYFTKAIAKDGTSHLGYYYRGLANIQQNKLKEAKPDLQKVIELAPDSSEAKDAKDYLKSIK